MLAKAPEFLRLLDQYHTEWSTYVQRLEADGQLLHTLKQGMELLLLSCAFLAYYLIDCLVQAIAFW